MKGMRRQILGSGAALLLAGWLATINPGGVRAAAAASALGIFEDHGDVGAVLHTGSTEYDAAKGSYTLVGSGENVWFAKDEFQFAWKKMSGDVALSADIAFVGTGGNAHRKGLLMIRQSLDTDAAYADVALHGDGMTSLQYRDTKGATTQEIRAEMNGPKHFRLEKRGQTFAMWLSGNDGPLQLAGSSPNVSLKEPFYVGIGLSAHDKDATERAVFTNVKLIALEAAH